MFRSGTAAVMAVCCKCAHRLLHRRELSVRNYTNIEHGENSKFTFLLNLYYIFIFLYISNLLSSLLVFVSEAYCEHNRAQYELKMSFLMTTDNVYVHFLIYTSTMSRQEDVRILLQSTKRS